MLKELSCYTALIQVEGNREFTEKTYNVHIVSFKSYDNINIKKIT